MCGIFGYLYYGNDKYINKEHLLDIIESLSYESAARGTDSTGIAFINNKGVLEIQKAPKPSYSFKIKYPEHIVRCIMGHTRHTTQGSEKNNINNHPFKGKIGNKRFALAHNGIIFNEDYLKMKYDLPRTAIQTDSYVAVQLLEKEKSLNMQAIVKMSEAIEGNFCFTILDNTNSLYIVKGDNPVSIAHHKKLKLYLYASTDRILMSALSKSDLYKSFLPTARNSEDIDFIHLKDGEILKIEDNGKLSSASFIMNTLKFPYSFQKYIPDTMCLESDTYFDQLVNFSKLLGYDEDFIKALIHEGLSYDEIENYIYGDIYYV